MIDRNLEQLNPEQRRAAEYGIVDSVRGSGPLLIIAGAGSGKTNTLAHRVALLLAHGARLDVFAAAMLGETEVVRSVIAAQPEVVNSLGPHGIPLRAHAQAGGEEARSVLELLDSAV